MSASKVKSLAKRLPLVSKAFLAVGVTSLVYLLLPSANTFALVAVYACAFCAGVLSFCEVLDKTKRNHQIPGLTLHELLVVRTMEFLSIAMGLPIILRLV